MQKLRLHKGGSNDQPKCQNRLIPCKWRHSPSLFFFLGFEKKVRESVSSCMVSTGFDVLVARLTFGSGDSRFFFIEILRIAYSTKIKCLPEQGLTWHLSFCNDVPWQLGPPSLGGGLLQRRCLCRSPAPQWALHSDHWDQTDQPPDTATNQVKQTKTKLIIEEF